MEADGSEKQWGASTSVQALRGRLDSTIHLKGDSEWTCDTLASVERQAVLCIAASRLPGRLCSSAPDLAIPEVGCQHRSGGAAVTARTATASKACATIAASAIATDGEGLKPARAPKTQKLMRRTFCRIICCLMCSQVLDYSKWSNIVPHPDFRISIGGRACKLANLCNLLLLQFVSTRSTQMKRRLHSEGKMKQTWGSRSKGQGSSLTPSPPTLRCWLRGLGRGQNKEEACSSCA